MTEPPGAPNLKNLNEFDSFVAHLEKFILQKEKKKHTKNTPHTSIIWLSDEKLKAKFGNCSSFL